MNWRKVLRWLGSYPLERVRRKRYTVPAGIPATSPLGEAIREIYSRTTLLPPDEVVHFKDLRAGRTMEWRKQP